MCGSKNGSIKILLPDDILKNISHLMYKTIVLGNIARFCSIYKVKEIIIYDTGETWKQKGFDLEIIDDVLNYMATPQYLRKKIFFKKKTLTFAGILPPLNTPNHPQESTDIGEIFRESSPSYRVGRIERVSRNITWIDAGLTKEIELPYINEKRSGQLVNLKLEKAGQDILGHIIEEKDIPQYWGYNLTVKRKTLMEIIPILKDSNIIIATSKHGINYLDIICEESYLNLDFKNKDVFLIFGPRKTGLLKFFNSINEMENNFDLIVNLFPDPGTLSIRLEESIQIALFFIQKLKKNLKNTEG